MTTDPLAPTLIDAHGKHAQAVAFTRDGALLVSCGQDAAVRLWSTQDFGAKGAFEGHTKCVNTLSLHPKGERIATGASDGDVRVWSFPGGATLERFPDASHARYSRDGRHLGLIRGKCDAQVLGADDHVPRCEAHKVDARLTAIEFTADGAELLAGGGSGSIYRMDCRGGEVIDRIDAHPSVVAALALAPDGGRLASTGMDGRLALFDTATWDEERSVPLEAQGGTLQIAFAPDSAHVAVSADGLLQIFDAATGARTLRLEIKVKGVYGIAFSPEGDLLAAACADGKIRIYVV